jgi:hypothetical protein
VRTLDAAERIVRTTMPQRMPAVPRLDELPPADRGPVPPPPPPPPTASPPGGGQP